MGARRAEDVAGVLALARRAVAALVVLLALTRPLFAQSGVAVTGTVADQTGAILPSAAIELRGADGVTRQSTTTTETGTFEFHGVVPGRYDVVASFPGFKTTTARVTVGSRAPSPIRVTMPLASIEQEVTVGDSPADVRAAANANIDSNVIDEQALSNLPVFNEDVVGTVSRFLDSSAIGTNGVMLIVNGVEVNSLTLPAAAIQQIKINQDPYAPEFRQPGRGRIEIVTKPGSQNYSGTANVTFRDAALDARNYFAVDKPPEQRRVFEGFLGGPVRHRPQRRHPVGVHLQVVDATRFPGQQVPLGVCHQVVGLGVHRRLLDRRPVAVHPQGFLARHRLSFLPLCAALSGLSASRRGTVRDSDSSDCPNPAGRCVE